MHRFLLILLTVLAISGTSQAQTTEEQAREDLRYGGPERTRFAQRSDRFIDKIWFGTGAQLGFTSNGFSSFFNIGLSPIAGYKLNQFLSVGPRIAINYNRYTEDLGGGDELKEGFFTYSYGPFVRARVYRGFFVHGEYAITNEVVTFEPVQGSPSDFDPVRRSRAIPFLGAGLSQGGGPGQTGFEILILFRLTQPDVINDSPYEFRTGLNYNF